MEHFGLLRWDLSGIDNFNWGWIGGQGSVESIFDGTVPPLPAMGCLFVSDLKLALGQPDDL